MFPKLLALFLLVPVAELAIFYWLGSRLGLGTTLLIIVLTGFLGAALTKSQGLRVLHDFRQSSAAGKLPHAPIVEGLIILVAGALLLTPGFLTDAIGFAALVPAVRQRIRRKLSTALAGRIRVVGAGMPGNSDTPANSPQAAPPRVAKGKVIDV